MKKIAQFATSLALAVLVLQQAIAGLACAPRHRAVCAADCPMAAGMGADCPMSGQMATSACNPNCCAKVLPQLTAPWVASKRLHEAVLTAANAFPAAGLMDRAVARFVPLPRSTASPPIYILNQVFRI